MMPLSLNSIYANVGKWRLRLCFVHERRSAPLIILVVDRGATNRNSGSHLSADGKGVVRMSDSSNT